MKEQGFSLFASPIGHCGIAWGERGIVCVQLPEASQARTKARLLERFPATREAPQPADVKRAIKSIAALLQGKPADLSSISLDMDGLPPFHRRVYEFARTIPPGSTRSYGEIATGIGSPGSARAVGQALGRNRFAIVVPCHRVLASGGKVGGFSAEGGVTTKLRMLSIEGARIGVAAPPAGGAAALEFDTEAAVKHLRVVDPVLGRLIDSVGPCGLQRDKTSSLFLALMEAIVYQQLTGKAAATIFGRVCALFPSGRKGPSAAQLLCATDEQLRGAGLSRAKALALRDLAEKVETGALPSLAEVRGMDNEEIVERLTAVRGIGRWTVEMLLIFRLGRPDVLPVDDYGVRKGYALAWKKRELPKPNDLGRLGARWAPYRSVASWYLWRAVDRAK